MQERRGAEIVGGQDDAVVRERLEIDHLDATVGRCPAGRNIPQTVSKTVDRD